jgi:hypothetical protein
MPERALETALRKRFQAKRAAQLDIVVRIATAQRTLAMLHVVRGELRFEAPREPLASFFFDSHETAIGVLAGGADPTRAFMAGGFRADGHLPLVFVLLGLFRPEFAAEAPP